MEHSEEILNVKCLEYSSPSWARSVLANDQAIKWAKAMCRCWFDSVLCVGQMKESPGAVERWKGPVEGLKFFFVQHAVGIDGEAIEFEWTFSQDFHYCLFLKRSSKIWREGTSIDNLTESIWNPKFKSNMLTPNTNSLTFWPKEVSRKMNGITCCVCSKIMNFSMYSCSHLKSFSL